MRDVWGYLQYRLNRLFARASGAQYLVVAVLASIVVLIGANAYFFGLFSPAALEAEGIEGEIDRGLLDSLWWSLKHVIDPGAFSEDYGAPWPVIAISLSISVLGLVIFGILIAVISTLAQRRFESLRRGNTVVHESGHTLILGWSQKLVPVLRLLAEAAPDRTVVVLAPLDVGRMEDALRLSADQLGDLDVVLRSGSTSRLAELERVGLASATRVISLAYDREGGSGGDIESIKTLMHLSGYDGWRGERPRMVVEITQKRNVDVANIAGSRSIPIVSSSEIISRVIVQSARQPGMSDVYARLFYHPKTAIRVRTIPEAAERTFGDVSFWFPTAIPLGICWRADGRDGSRIRAALNPEPDYDIAPDEQLILLCEDLHPKLVPDGRPAGVKPDGDGHKYRPRLNRILILGWNDNIDEILTEFDGHSAGDTTITVVAGHEDEYARQYLVDAVAGGFRNLRLDYRKGDATNRAWLETLDPFGFDVIVTLADESQGEDDPDARTILTLLQLSDIDRAHPERGLPHVVSEIYDPASRELLRETPARDVVLSSEMVSMQLAEISRNPVLASIYRELLSAGGIECSLRPPSRYLAPGRERRFADYTLAAQAYFEIPLGFRLAAGDGGRGRVVLNPGLDSTWTLTDDDRVIVLAQQVYD